MVLQAIDLIFEFGRFAFMIGIVTFICWIGWSRQLHGNWAWRFSVLAFLLLLFGAGVDVMDEHETTRAYFGWTDSTFNLMIESAGYLGGFGFMFLAAWRWLPHSDTLIREKLLAESSRSAAERQHDMLRNQLTQAQKMEAIGVLTGGVAHDFNNLLMVIDGYTRRAADNRHKQPIVDDALQQVLAATQRAAALTKQLLVFSRRQAMEKMVARVADVIASIQGLLVQAAGERITLLLEIDDGGSYIETDSNEFCQTLLNLTINARDAMPDGGVLTIASRLVNDRKGMGDAVEISVTDTGVGMDEATVERIFEPFFTTKVRGKGTGLGLATVYGFTQAFGGEIGVRSTPGYGTTMSLFFPVSERTLIEVPTETTHAVRGGSETILLVEDNQPALKLIHETLTEFGYEVLSAPSGFEALEIEMNCNSAIDLILTDVVMPGLSGIDVARAVRNRRPGAKIIFMSGYTDEFKKIGQLPVGATFLQKPVDLNRLAKAIRTRLDQPELSEAS